AVGGFARSQDRAGAEGRGIEVFQVAAGCGPGFLHCFERGRRLRRLAAAREPAGAELGDEITALRAEGRDMRRDRIVDVDVALLGIEEADLMGAILVPFDSLAAQQRLNDTK